MKKFILISIAAIFLLSCQEEEEKPNYIAFDLDGNAYTEIQLGTQTWMVENYACKQYRNGKEIETTELFDNIEHLDYASFCWPPFGSEKKIQDYGVLYTWKALENLYIPDGWRIPTKEDWEILINYLGGELDAGRKLRSGDPDDWWEVTDKLTGMIEQPCGFNAKAIGLRRPSGGFYGEGKWTYFWTKSLKYNDLAFYVEIYGGHPDARIQYTEKNNGFSLRLIKE